MKRQITTLIFDLGNVIIDLNDERHWWEEFFLGIFRKEPVVAMYNDGFFRRYESGGMENDEFLDRLSIHLLRGHSKDDIIERWLLLLGELPAHRLETLESLGNHYNIFLLSNTNDLHLGHIINNMENRHGRNPFNDLFDKEYYSHHLNAVKPDARIYELLLEDAGIVPESALFLDDKPENLEGAARFGIQTMHVPKGKEFSELLKDAGILTGG